MGTETDRKARTLDSKPGQNEMVFDATTGAKGAHTGPWLLLSWFWFLLTAHRSSQPLESLMVFLILPANEQAF